jgi:hypothetical protein
MARKYEGSREDRKEDARGARRLGVSLRKYETTARDKREDRAGGKRTGKTKEKR